MKKIVIVITICFFILSGCSNTNTADTVSREEYEHIVEEVEELKSHIESLEKKLESLESNNIMESNDANKYFTELYNDIIDDPNVPEEYKRALEKAIYYGEEEHLSISAIYDRLTAKPLSFSEEAAQYALDNYECDNYLNALKYAQEYDRLANLSKIGMFKHLTSNNVKFSKEEAQYAIDNIDANWEKNALNLAKLYQGAMSIDGIRQALEMSEFTEEEINYALDNLE